jgi:hypothetical protein
MASIFEGEYPHHDKVLHGNLIIGTEDNRVSGNRVIAFFLSDEFDSPQHEIMEIHWLEPFKSERHALLVAKFRGFVPKAEVNTNS